MNLTIFCNKLSEETSGRHILALQHLILYFLVLPTVCEVPVWEPYGPVMCGQECMKLPGCKSFIFRASELSCTLKCNPCHEEPLNMDTFCSNVSKIKSGSHFKRKFIHPMGNITKICDNGERETHKKAWNRLLCTSPYSESFFIIDLANDSQKTEIQVGHRISKISDFTDTKVLIDVLLPLGSVILFDIESKQKTTVLQNVYVWDMAKGERDGIVYVLGGKKLKSIWEVSYPLKIEKVDFPNLLAFRFEYDPRSATFYMIVFSGSNYVYRRNFRKTSKPDIYVPKHKHGTMALDAATNNLYVFSEISSFRIPLPNTKYVYIPMTFKVMSARFFFDEFYFSRYYKNEHKYKLFKAASKNINQHEMDTTVVFIAKKRINMP